MSPSCTERRPVIASSAASPDTIFGVIRTSLVPIGSQDLLDTRDQNSKCSTRGSGARHCSPW